MITVKELREIVKSSEITAKENLHDWVLSREKTISETLKQKAQQGERRCCIAFPEVIDEYHYTYTEMKELLKKEFPDFTITSDSQTQGNYWFVLEW